MLLATHAVTHDFNHRNGTTQANVAVLSLLVLLLAVSPIQLFDNGRILGHHVIWGVRYRRDRTLVQLRVILSLRCWPLLDSHRVLLKESVD